MKGVLKVPMFWPLFLVTLLVGANLVAAQFPSRTDLEHVQSAPVARSVDSSFLATLPVAIASGVPGMPTSSADATVVSNTNDIFWVNATAILGGNGPFHCPKAAKTSK